MKKKYIAGLVLVSFVVLIGWFVTNRTSDSGPENRVLKIGLNPWIGNGIYYVAQEKGLFEKENIKVEFVHYDDGTIGKQLLASGEIDVLDLTPETAVVLYDSGVKIKVIGMTDTSEGADGIIATNDIKTVADLKGKKVAFESGSPSHLLLSYLLDQQGLSTKDLVEVNMPAPDTGSAFISGSVDAAVSWEPWLSKAVERPGGKILASSKTAPIIPNLLMVKEEQIKDNSTALKSMLRALFESKNYIAAHPDESYEIMAKGLGITSEDVKHELPTFRWLDYKDNVTALTNGEYSAVNSINRASSLWLKSGLIKNPVKGEELVDQSIINSLYQ